MKCNKLVDVGRRQFLRGSALSAVGVAAATVMAPAAAQAQALARVDYPVNRLGNVGDLKVNEPMDVAYPDADSPGVLLKLGSAVQGGVVRRRMIWNSRADFVADGLGSSGSGYAA
jgi:arsenite oxidase small subunit